MLEALPVVAEPPVVLPITFASPVDEDWLVLLETVAVLVEVKTSELVLLNITWLLELGPVVFILALLAPLPEPQAAAAALAPVLLSDAVVLVVLLLLAAPLIAPPPVVLCITLALPVDEPWPVLFDTPP